MGWLDLSKKFYFDSLNGKINYLTSIVSLSIPSEFPVTDFKFGPKKTKNFFIFYVIKSKSLKIFVIYLHLSTSGRGWNSHLYNCSSSIDVWVFWNSESHVYKTVLACKINYFAIWSWDYAFSSKSNNFEIWIEFCTLSAISSVIKDINYCIFSIFL